MPLTRDRPLVFRARWGHEPSWFVIEPGTRDVPAVRAALLRQSAVARRASGRRVGGALAGWTSFGVCAAAIPIVWAALRVPAEWAPLGAVASVIAFVGAVTLGLGVHARIAPSGLPPLPRHLEAIPDFVADWADDDTPDALVWTIASAARRAADLRENYFSELLTESLGHAHWIDDEVLAPAMLTAWRRELDRISDVAPGLTVPHSLRPVLPPAPPELRPPPSIPE